MAVTLNGKKLKDPYSSVLTIENNGAKPILSNKFESPISIEADSKTTVIDARAIGVRPVSLMPMVSIAGRSINIQPLLLNPGDGIVIAMLTEDGSPVLRSRVRIVGVPDVIVLEESEKSKVSWKTWLAAMCAPLTVAASLMLMLSILFRNKSFDLFVSILVSLGAVFSATTVAMPLWDAYFERTLVYAILLAILTTSIAAFITLASWKSSKNLDA